MQTWRKRTNTVNHPSVTVWTNPLQPSKFRFSVNNSPSERETSDEKLSLLTIVLTGFLAACDANEPTQPTELTQTSEKNMPGSDGDARGCIGSAGYTWCAKTNECERRWELAEEKGFENTEEAFDEYCGK